MARRPNVLLFISHDTGMHLSPYGVATVHTPAAERLAAEGVRFAKSYCTSPLCCPSRAATVTGRYPHQNGVMGLTGERTGSFAFFAGERHAAAQFAAAGYESVLCGFEHESNTCREIGFERLMCGDGQWHNGGVDLEEYGPEIARWLAARDDDRPFYLQIGCHETHHDWLKNTEPDDSLGVTMPSWLVDDEVVRDEMRAFQGAVRKLDRGIERILVALDAAGVADDTIVVYTTDHGIDVPMAKGTCRDKGIEVFLFMRYPGGGWRAGSVEEALVSNVDILPTLFEACGIEPTTDMAGRSFLPLLTGEGAFEPRDAVFAGKTYHDTYDPQRCVRTARWKYIRHFEVNIFQDLRLATVSRRGMWPGGVKGSTKRVSEELYDLGADPEEAVNLAGEPAHAATLDELRGRLLEHMTTTDDPLLRGPVASPHYARQLAQLRAAGGVADPA